MHTSYVTRDMPKERLEVVTKRGALTADEFVEMRTFGPPNAEPVYRFAGHRRSISRTWTESWPRPSSTANSDAR